MLTHAPASPPVKTVLRPLLFLFSLSLVAFQPAFAHNAALRGQVQDAATRQPLRAATVQLSGTEKRTVTDAFGQFRFENLPEGSYELVISFVGFETLRQAVILKENETADLRLSLQPGAVLLDEVSVRSEGGVERADLLSRVDVTLRPVRTTQDLLRNVPGLFIAQHAGGGKAEQLFLRGFDLDHGTDIAISVDGMPVNMVSHAHGQGYADLHFVIPETVGTVNFGKGPYAASKGDLATAGYVAFRTKDALPGSLLKMETGSYGTNRGVLLLNALNKNNQSAYVAAEFSNTRGFFENPQHFNRLNFLAKYTGSPDERTRLSASVSAFGSNWDASGQVPERAVAQGLITRFGSLDPTEGGRTDRYNLNLELTRQLDNGAFVRQQVYATRYDFELFSNFTFFRRDSINGDQIRQRESRFLTGYQGVYGKDGHWGDLHHYTEIGAGLRYDATTNSELDYTRQRRILSTAQRGDIRQTNLSAYWEETLDLTARLRLTAALRYDRLTFDYRNDLDSNYARQSRTAGVFSPKLALSYTFSDRVRVYANAGLGFHSNDARTVLGTNRPSLPRALGYEVGASLKPTSRLLVKTALWALNLQQEFVYVGDEGVIEPSGRSRRTGVDLSVRWQPLDWLFADADLSLARPRFPDEPEGRQFVPLAPPRTSAGGLTARAKSGWGASLRYRCLGSRPANADGSVTAHGYNLLDAALSYQRPHVEVTLSVENALNRDWNEAQFATESRLRGETAPVGEIHFTPGTPRFARLAVGWKF